MTVQSAFPRIVACLAVAIGLGAARRVFAEASFNISPGFLLLKGIGATVDTPLNAANDLRIGLAVVNTKHVKFGGLGLGLLHNFDSRSADAHFYLNTGLAVGQLSVRFDGADFIAGTLFEAHALVGRQTELPNGLRTRFGLGLGYGQYTESADSRSGLGGLFFGLQPRVELQLGYTQPRQSWHPPGRW